MQAIFAWNFGSVKPITPRLKKIIAKIPKVDDLIRQYAPKWPLESINWVDLAILRCALWELNYVKKSPVKVIIDEAIELAKEFGTENSASFVNGVLGSIIKANDQPPPRTSI